ncbi:MAG TPA: hypothetical protein VK961_26880 [Chthoniobacter sp.]|nr:hypothetical protein [Chthoniobacter sp.]
MPKLELTAEQYEAALTARAHEMMAASHNLLREQNAALPRDQRKPLPGWSVFVDAAAAELDATIEEAPAEDPKPAKAKKGSKPAPAPEPTPAAEPAPAPATEPTPEPAPAN